MLTSMTVRGTLLALACAISVSAHALADAPKNVDIAAGELRPALLQLSKAFGVELLYQPAQLKGLHTAGVRGTYTPDAAVRILLKGTPLELRTDPSGAMLVIDPKSPADAAVTSSSAQTSPPANNGDESQSRSSLQLAQAAPGQAQGDTSVEKSDEQSSQQTPAKSEGALSEILIKGSRVMNVDVKRTEDDVQPYYILDSTMIEQSGATNVEDFLKQRLTMNTTVQSNSQSYGSTLGATSSINLRGLGTNETLILVNGRRSAGVTLFGAANQPDINGIPLSAVERIEVLPSSASAIYGGAAVGGVVNIVLKRNFQGGDISYTYENTTEASAPLRTLNATYGTSLFGGRTQIMLSGHYGDGSVLVMQDRLGLTEGGIARILANSPTFFYSPGVPFPGATTNIASADGSNLILRNGTPLNAPITYIPAGSTSNSNLGPGLVRNAGSYNLNLAPGTGQYGLQNPMGNVPRTKSVMLTVRQEVTSSIEVFTELSDNSNSSRTLYNPFYNTFPVPSAAPDNPFRQDVLVNIPSALSAPFATDSVTRSATLGLLARISDDWKSELDYTWSENSFEFAYDQYDYTALTAALADGTLNPFVDTILHPLTLAPYLSPNTFDGRSTLNDLGLRISGFLGSLPGGRPTLTVGLEHRKEGFDNSSYVVPTPLTPADFFQQVFFGQSQSTNSIYAEAEVPLVAAKNDIPGVRDLDLQLAGRSERYQVHAGTAFAYLAPPVLQQCCNPPQGVHSTIGYTSTNPTIGFKYKPVGDITFRLSYSKAFLPPTESQLLYNPTLDSPIPYISITDPKNGQTYQVNTTGRSGGNPNLKPQTSRDWDLGVVLEPQGELVKGLRVDVEYYSITQPNYITTPFPQLIVSNPGYSSRVTRDPATGLITVVDVSPLNATEYKTSGWDLTVDYRKPTRVGTFGLHALATIISHDLRQYTIGGPFLDYVGYPNDGGEARTKGNVTLSWEYRGWSAGWTTTYVSRYLQQGSPGSPSVAQFGPNDVLTQAQGGYSIPSQVYHELFAGYSFHAAAGPRAWSVNSILSNVTVQVGIKNIFNTSPPFDAFYSPYFYSPYGDPRLRDYWLTVRKGF
jgi:iron complex outermembrane receptor protein